MISILILTKNEERNIRRVLESVAWSDDIVVLDSQSTDATSEIAQSMNARVVVRTFDNWSAHQNWAVQNIKFRHPWVCYLDADEQCDQQLKEELLKYATSDSKYSAFRVRRKDHFLGTWLKRSQLYPTWLIRIYRPQAIRYERLVNPVAIVDGEVGELSGHIVHHPFSHGVEHWYSRHNNYSTLESRDLQRENATPLDLAGCFSRDSNRRRKAIKQLAYRLPGRPFFMFLYLYFIRLGFLDGTPGLYYSAMRSSYELMINVKVAEQRYLEKAEKNDCA